MIWFIASALALSVYITNADTSHWVQIAGEMGQASKLDGFDSYAPHFGTALCSDDSAKELDVALPNGFDSKFGVQCCKKSASTKANEGSRPDCKTSATYEEALELCESKGQMLCFLDQIDNGVGGNGCGMDINYVWTRDECNSNTEAPIFSHVIDPHHWVQIGGEMLQASKLDGYDAYLPHFGTTKCVENVATALDASLPDGFSQDIAVQCCNSRTSLDTSDGTRSGCISAATFEDAYNYCESKGKIVCSRDQIDNGVGGSGCGFDVNYIWTRDNCNPDDLPVPPHTSDIGTSHWTQIGGEDLKASQIDGYDDTMPHFNTGKCVENSETALDVSLPDGFSQEFAVQCCKTMTSAATDRGSRSGCKTSATFEEAKDHCTSMGQILCSRTQVDNGVGGNGCGFDVNYVWTRDDCTEYSYTVMHWTGAIGCHDTDDTNVDYYLGGVTLPSHFGAFCCDGEEGHVVHHYNDRVCDQGDSYLAATQICSEKGLNLCSAEQIGEPTSHSLWDWATCGEPDAQYNLWNSVWTSTACEIPESQSAHTVSTVPSLDFSIEKYTGMDWQTLSFLYLFVFMPAIGCCAINVCIFSKQRLSANKSVHFYKDVSEKEDDEVNNALKGIEI